MLNAAQAAYILRYWGHKKGLQQFFSDDVKGREITHGAKADLKEAYVKDLSIEAGADENRVVSVGIWERIRDKSKRLRITEHDEGLLN